MNSPLFSPLQLRDLTLKNRIAMSPMLMYMAGEDGLVTDRHFVHYGARALGGVGLVMTEVVAVSPRGRISANDLGLWNDGQIEGVKRICRFLHECGTALGVQLAHAGRKASIDTRPQAPSEIAYPGLDAPEAIGKDQLAILCEAYVAAAKRAAAADVDLIEIHAAHGYLLHSFLCPLTNTRTDAYGGNLEGRARFVLEIVEAVREVWPTERPLAVRMTAVDHHDGGVTEDEGLWLCRRLAELGVDLLDVSTGNLIPEYSAPVYPGYPVRYAEKIGRKAGLQSLPWARWLLRISWKRSSEPEEPISSASAAN